MKSEIDIDKVEVKPNNVENLRHLEEREVRDERERFISKQRRLVEGRGFKEEGNKGHNF